jgi:hypothetical protein
LRAEFQNHRRILNIPQNIPFGEHLKIMSEDFPQAFDALNEQLLNNLLSEDPVLKEKIIEIVEQLED